MTYEPRSVLAPRLPNDRLEVLEDLRPVEGGGKLPNPGPRPLQVQAWIPSQNTFDVGEISRPVRHCLHDEEILGRDKRHAHPLHFDPDSSCHGLLLEGEPSQADIQVQQRRLMAKKKDPVSFREAEGIRHPWGKTKSISSGKELRPAFGLQRDQEVDIPGHARSSQNAGRETADDDSLHPHSFKPRDKIAEERTKT